MIKTVSRLAAATAALGLVAAPIMAQANTRAGDSNAVYSVGNAAPGLGRSAEGEDIAGRGVGFVVLLIGGTLFVVGILTATDVLGDDDGDCASPGAC
jgi:hypothetical protein